MKICGMIRRTITAMEKTKNWLLFEKRIEEFVRKLGFSDVSHDPEGFRFQDSRCQIDVICGSENNVLLIECRTQEVTGPSEDIKKWIALMNGRRGEYTKVLGAHPKYKKYKNVFLVLAVGKEVIVSESNSKYAEDLDIAMWGELDRSCYEKQPTILREVTLHNILADLGATVPAEAVHTAVAFKTLIKVHSKAFNAYSFSAAPTEIIKYCYVARREQGKSDYYQRIIDSSRLNSVADYINKGGSFINNIIVAHDPIIGRENLSFTPIHNYLGEVANDDLIKRLGDSAYNLEIGILQFPLSYKSFWVIDGQHRLFGYSAANDLSRAGATVPVVMIEQIPKTEQMRLFVDINHKQKTINANLIWDIKGDIEPETIEGAVSNLVKALDEKGPLQGQIKIPAKRNRAPINLSALCRAIIKSGLMKDRVKWVTENKNPFFKSKDVVLSAQAVRAALDDYFESLKSELDTEIFEDIVLNSTAIEILVALFSLTTVNIKLTDNSEARRQKYRSWLSILKQHIDKRLIGELRKATGEALKDDATKKLLGLLAEGSKDQQFILLSQSLAKEIPGFQELERELRQWIGSLFDRYGNGESFDVWLSRTCPQRFDPSGYQILKKNFSNRDPHRLKLAKLSDFLSLGNIRALLLNPIVNDLFIKARAEIGTLSPQNIINHLNFVLPERNIDAHDLPLTHASEAEAQAKHSVTLLLNSIAKYREYFAEIGPDG